ncbi:MAG: hypothetical protein R3330_09735 [Saprospiraceae bacterium]|nr:hypothetical protein [Saprospiraceae bacterium]
MLEKIGNFIYSRAIGRYRSTNLHQIGEGHFENIRSVGIIFNASDPATYETILGLRDRLQQRDKEVQLLGYFPIDEEDVGPQHFGYFTRKHLNFAQLPKSDIVKQFIARPFDVLINLDPQHHKPVAYICAASRALFKIGPGGGNPTHFDLMIDMKESFDLQRYIKDIRHTFNLLN